jgi:alkanesulfonate monooxygenase SsuD/methylene tetrahydromethanopterin reductase-like flavin-dependent oxidoreductase (luciferase family)
MANAWARTGPLPEPPLLTAADEQELRATALVGPPEQIAERILAYKAIAGDRFHFSGRMYFPGMDAAVQRETMQIFAEEVAPLVRS